MRPAALLQCAEERAESMSQAVVIRPVPFLDKAAQALAWALSRISRITSVGVFHLHGGPAFVDAWREGAKGGPGSWTVRLGRVEFVADLRGR
jgi:hypothetical protein